MTEGKVPPPEAFAHQLPFNVIESNGLQTAKKAKDTYGMHVMALRPLTVVDPPVLWKLEGLPDPAHKDSWSGIDQVQKLDAVFQETADYFVPPEPVSSENPTKDELELIEACGYMKTLLTDLKSELPKFVSEDHYEMNLTADLIPLIHKTFDGMDETSIEVLQNFFKAYGDAVRAVAPYHAKKYIESVLDPFPPDGGDGIQRVHQVPDDVKLEQYSLKWLMRKQSPIDTILLDVTSMGTLG